MSRLPHEAPRSHRPGLAHPRSERPNACRPTERPRRARVLSFAIGGSVLLSLAPASEAQAQRETRTNASSWLSSAVEVPISARFTWLADVSLRRSGGVRDPQQLVLRAGVGATVASDLRVAAGYARLHTSPYGEAPAPAAFPEHRLWQQVQLRSQTGPLAWSHRYRLEQRWTGRTNAAAPGRVLDWHYTNRARYQARLTIPLRGRTVDAREPYLVAGDEVMVNFGRGVRMNVFDQNRIQVAVGYRLGLAIRVETGYLDQLVAKPDGRLLERNQTWVTGLSFAPVR